MSDLIRSVILGIVQGLTEFLPVSSSGHLELINHILGSSESVNSDFTMVLIVHFGTAMSILYVFRKKIAALIMSILSFRNGEDSRYALKIVISMIPAVLVGLLLEEHIEALFSGEIIYTGIFFLVTAIVLFITPSKGSFNNNVSHWNSFVMGIAQAVAILPGVSRSGATIATALGFRINKSHAAQFSFLMVLPLIVGKIGKDIISAKLVLDASATISILIAFLTSFFVGIWACKYMIKLVERSHLRYFAYYCCFLGILTIGLFFYD